MDTLPGDDVQTDQDRKVTNLLEITPGYFEAMDVPDRAGQGPRDSDREGARDRARRSTKLLVPNGSWPDEEPIGTGNRVRRDSRRRSWEWP